MASSGQLIWDSFICIRLLVLKNLWEHYPKFIALTMICFESIININKEEGTSEDFFYFGFTFIN